MACSKDQGCLTIANSIYPRLRSEIGNSINTITTSMNGIMSELGELIIPEDYLGTKVTKKLDEIISNLTSDVGEVDSISGSINGFIDEKKEEHQEHYRQWKERQGWTCPKCGMNNPSINNFCENCATPKGR